MTSPADELRAAAEKLREHAHYATDGPWVATPDILIGGWAVAQAPLKNPEGPYLADFVRDWDARYIALMDPGVGHALADWLDHHAHILTAATQYDPDSNLARPALKVARALNGDAR
ncbi:hypothetical protein ACFWV1_26250 [Streptomyces sp. NPDC058700]|uniref:hypothetical protein n=1 Tax=Streptomyces sp. NPDC058700 TaxID=3346607 RepID=UPI00365489B6